MIGTIILSTLGLFGVILVLASIKIIGQNERGSLETLGKFSRMLNPGLTFVIPLIQTIKRVDITEQMSEIDRQEIITEDKLNCTVDLVVFYKVKEDEKSVFNSLYKIYNFRKQIVVLGQTTARDVMGGMAFKDVNSQRNTLNKRLADIMKKETTNWGVDIIRVELKEIIPPKDVQEIMNKVLKAENEKRAAVDFATAAETVADGKRRAAIQEAEGIKQAKILFAEGEAKYNELINKSFKGKEVQMYKKLETVQNSLKDNTKVVLTDKGISPSIILGDIPFKNRRE